MQSAGRTLRGAGAVLVGLLGYPDHVVVQLAGRALGRVVAVVGSGVMGLAVAGFGVAAVVAGHGDFSGGVGVALIGYGLIMLAAAVAFWRGSVFGRGPVLATAALNLAAALSFTPTAPLAWAVVVVAAVTVVTAALPASSASLKGPFKPGDGAG